jgi:hypothetical protein
MFTVNIIKLKLLVYVLRIPETAPQYTFFNI